MPSHYCVVQFVPDPLADERVNVGVLAFDEERVRSAFLEDWRRAIALAGRSVTPLRKVIRDLERATSDDLQQEALLSPTHFHRLTAELVEHLANRWSHSIQLTPPRGSLADVDTVLAEMSAVMLKQGTVRRRGQTKLELVRIARVQLEQALFKLDARDKPRREVETRIEVAGRLTTHKVDIGILNGSPRIAAQAISFSRVTSQQVQRDVDATAWVLDDIQHADAHPYLAVIVTEPANETRQKFDDAVELFGKLVEGGVVRQRELARWAQHAAELALA